MYNYYTDDEEDSTSSEDIDNNTENEQNYPYFRAFCALLFPLSISVGLGVFLRLKIDKRKKDKWILTYLAPESATNSS